MSKYGVSREALISVPLPESTSTYKCVPNKQLIDLTLESLQGAGFSLDREYYTSAREGNVSTGSYTIKNVDDNDMRLQIMWRNSYDKSVSLSFSVGCQIKVCSNGMYKSQEGSFFRRKHTGDVQEFAPQHIIEYIKKGADIFQQMQVERDIMKEIQLSKETQARLVGDMFLNHNFIKSTQINIIKRELENPTYSYGAPNSLWELYQFSSFAMREIHPSLYLQDHLDAHSFFVNEAGILQSETISVPHEHTIPENDSPYKQLDWTEEIKNY